MIGVNLTAIYRFVRHGVRPIPGRPTTSQEVGP